MKPASFARAAAVLAIALTGLAVASPAAAAPPPLPDGDYLYTLSCDSRTPTLQLFNVNTDTAALTEVGTGTPADQACAYSPAWDYSTETAWNYYRAYDEVAGETRWYIAELDVATGASGPGVPVLLSGVRLIAEAFTIDLDGNAWLLKNDDSILDTGTFLYSVDLATGAATYVGWFATIQHTVFAFGVDPVSGDLYVIEQDGDVSTIDTTLLTSNPLATVSFPEVEFYYGLQIDSNGNLWIEGYSYALEASTLWSVPLADLAATPEFSGKFASASISNPYTFAPLIAPIAPPAPPAPATLPNMGMDATPALTLGVLLLVTGAFIALVVRTRKSYTE